MAQEIRLLQRSFNGGEVSPEFWSRVDDAKYGSGMAKCLNFIPKPQGGIENRAGTSFVREVKASAKKCRVIPFTYSTTQTMVVEISEGAFRFHTSGASLLAPAGTAWANQSSAVTISISPSSTVTFTLASPGVVNWTTHGLAANAPVTFTTAGTLPDGVTAGVTYYVTAPLSNSFNLSASPGGPSLDFSGTSVGVHTGFALTAAVVTWNAHPFVAGDSVSITTSGALPSGISAGVVYSVTSIATNTFQLTPTTGDSAVQTWGTQSGTHTAQHAYALGAVVTNGGSKYYAIADSTNVSPPNAGSWYLMPASGEYEIPNPYVESDIFDIHYVQSADVMTLVHPNYAPRELRRLSATVWTLSTIAFSTKQSPPTGVKAVAAGGTGTTYKYVVTSVDSQGFDESVASTQASCNGNLFASGGYNTISWKAIASVSRYRVYKLSGGLFGYIGQADNTTTFKDDNIAADMSRTPPIAQNLFNAAGDYPGAVSYYEQRRVFAGTTKKPQSIWMTKTGTESNMDYSLPIKDDDSIQFRVAARESNTIRHVVPLTSLLFLTSAAEWKLTSVNSDAVTPSTVSVTPQSYIGSSNVQPVIVGNNVIYCAARGGHVREMAYAWQNNGYISGDLTLRSSHLFDGLQISDMAYGKAPYPIVWFVSNSGALLSFTYVPEQQIGAWAQHNTDGAFESCCTVAEGDDDVLYVVVKRTINSVTKRYIERLHSRQFATLADAFFVDCGLTYSGAPATTISGLGHLEGKTVSILGDGGVMPRKVVAGGAITLDNAVSKAQIGLPITADMQTLPLAVESPDFAQGRQKNVSRVDLRVYRSSGIFVGPTFSKLTEYRRRSTEVYGSPPTLKSDEIRLDIVPTWASGGQVCVRQVDPLPLTITGQVIEVTVA